MIITIRPEQPNDAEAVYGVVMDAFGRSAEAGLVRDLTEDGDVEISLVAESAGAIVGHVLFSRLAAPLRALALAPVSVAPACQRQGIAAALIHRGLADARKAGWAAAFVLGDPAYYGRFGFDPAAAAGFTSPYAGPSFMGLPLHETMLAASGELRHAQAFLTLDEVSA